MRGVPTREAEGEGEMPLWCSLLLYHLSARMDHGALQPHLDHCFEVRVFYVRLAAP